MSTQEDLKRTRVRFSSALLPLRQRAILIGAMAALAIGVLVALLMLLGGMWLDLAVTLPVGLRRLVLGTSLVTAAIAVVTLVWQSRQQANERDLAFQIDQSCHADGRVMAGFDLLCDEDLASSESGELDSKDSLSLGLTSLAARQAEQMCNRVDPAEVISSNRASYWWRNVGFATAGVLLIAILAPRMAWTQAQRLLLPMESQLPYSATSLTVEPGDTEVLFGSDLEVFATIQGPLVDDLELVLRYDGLADESLPMLAETDERWRTYLTRVTRPADYFVRAKGTQSPLHHLSVRMTPQIESVSCIITPPAYTARPRYEGSVPDRGFEGLAGTTVDVTLHSNRPLSAGRLMLDLAGGKQELAFTSVQPSPGASSADGNRAVQGRFQITESGTFRMSVVDIDGTRSSDEIAGKITLLADQSPVIRLLQPKPLSLATPNIDLPIVIAAEDDFGLTRLELFRGLNQSPEMGTLLTLASSAASAKVATTLPLSAYGLEPGDEITLFARIEDNDPAGAKGAESPIATIRIISEQELAELELSRRGMEAILSKQRQAQRLMADLKRKLDEAQAALKAAREDQEAAEASKQSGDTDSEAKQAAADKAVQQAAEQLAVALAAAQNAAESIRQSAEVELPIDLDQELNKQLSELAEQLQELSERIQKLQEKLNSDQPLTDEEQQELQELTEQLDQMLQQHQDSAMDPTQRMSKILPLAADQQRFVQLARRQRNLAERLDALKTASPTDPATKRRSDELRREEQQLQVALSKLLDDIESHVKQLPDDPELETMRATAEEFVQNVRASQADPSMTETQQGLLSDNVQSASEQATLAADILESFLSQCESMGDQACQNCKASFKPSAGGAKPGNSIEQLLQRMGLGKGQSGMNPSMGAGIAGEGGYSMPQNTMDNIGVYGGLPTEPTKPQRGDGEKSDGGVATYEQGGSADATTSATGDQADPAGRGDAGAVVPSVYRKQVSDYFRQLAEELGDQ